VPAATLVLLVPYFFVSVAVERWVLRQCWRTLPLSRVALAAWAGNAVTYCGLGFWAWYQLQAAVHGRPGAG
jgi:hypothetical protein